MGLQIVRFEKENVSNWEKLYSAFENDSENPDISDKIKESARKLFQIRNKYIVCPVKSGLMLIDQKRAHERVLYEKFLGCLSNGNAVSQSDMFPVTAELNPSDYFILQEIEESIKLLGFRIEYPGENKITILAQPSGSESIDPLEFLEILVQDFKKNSV